MKIRGIIFLFISSFLFLFDLNGQEANVFDNDSIKYELQLKKSAFKRNKPIFLTLIAKNTSKKEIIPVSGEFKKEYYLRSILQLRDELILGEYELRYGNAEPIKFIIKYNYLT